MSVRRVKISKAKKSCDAETQISEKICYSWSYPKILSALAPAIKKIETGNEYVCFTEKWTNTVARKKLADQESNFKQRIKENAPRSKIFSTGVRGILRPSPWDEIRRKFPIVADEPRKAHSFDDGVVILPGPPGGRIPVPQRLRYRPMLKISSRDVPQSTVVPFHSRNCEDLRKKILYAESELTRLGDKKNHLISEVRKLEFSLDDDIQIKILKKLILGMQESPERLVAVKRHIIEYSDLFEEYVPTPISLLKKVVPSIVAESLPSPVKRPPIEKHEVFRPSIFNRLGKRVATPIDKNLTAERVVPASQPAPSDVSKPHSAVDRLRRNFAEYVPIPLNKKKASPKKSLADIIEELSHPEDKQKKNKLCESADNTSKKGPVFKIPEIPRKKKRPVRRIDFVDEKDKLEFAQICSNVDVAAERVAKRSKKMDDFVGSLFEGPDDLLENPSSKQSDQESSIDEELEKFINFEILDE